MLTSSDFDQWCYRLNLSENAKREILNIRTSDPSRHTGGGKKNVSGRYPSRKMGLTIQFESHKVELACIYQLEHDPDVLEYYDQPPPFKINYQSETGRNLGFYITPDFFVIRTDGFEWIECKTEERWQKLAQTRPNRYFLGEDNRWHSPPAEQYAVSWGGHFCLWSNAEVNWTLQRNLEFLEDYYRVEEIPILQSTSDLITSIVNAQPGTTLARLLHYGQGIEADDIYNLISRDTIYIDLTVTPFVEPENCFLFPDQTVASAYSALIFSIRTGNTINSPVIDLTAGTVIAYNNKSLTIKLVSESNILLQTEEGLPIEFTLDTFDTLVHQGKITSLSYATELSLTDDLMTLYLKASHTDLEKANQRYRSIVPYLNGQSIPANAPQERSLYYWLAAYRQAQEQHGYGYLGLLTFDNNKGNRNRKLPEFLLELMEKFISEDYEDKKQKSKSSVYNDFATYCENAGLSDDQIPSYKTFISEVKKRSGSEQTFKRSGSRAAYLLETFYWELKLTTPRHGDFPFHLAHIDHTELDIELRCSKTGKTLGRPWLTLLMDAFSRRILAVYITFDAPSYRSCMMTLRICVQRYGRLPQVIVTDNGKEFHSTYFETLLALFECTLKRRPSAKARFGGVCERLFGTTNTELVHNMAGNTQITKKVRLMTKSVNPKNLSLWTLGLLYLYLCEWAYEVYDTIEHPALDGQNPREAYTNGINNSGSRSHRRIPYDDNFRTLTLPTTDKGKAKVQPGKGIKIEHKYYWSTAFRDPEIENTLVNVRYEPFNAGIAYAYVRGHWVQCISEYYALYQGRSEKEILLATAQLNKRKQNHAKNYKIRAKQLGQFLGSVESEEVLLEQRLRDDQLKEVFRVIDGGLPNLEPYRVEAPIETNSSEITQISDNSRKASTKTELESDAITEEESTPINPSKLKIFKSY